MCETLQVRIAIDLDGDVDAEDIVASLIKENERKFHPLFERVIDTGDGRVTVLDGSFEITHIQMDRTGGCAEGIFLSDFYAGCRDLNSTDEHDVELPFEIEDGFLVFDIMLPPRWVVEL